VEKKAAIEPSWKASFEDKLVDGHFAIPNSMVVLKLSVQEKEKDA